MPTLVNIIITAAGLLIIKQLWQAGTRARDEAQAAKQRLTEQQAQLAETRLLIELEDIITAAQIKDAQAEVTALQHIAEHDLPWWEITPTELAHGAGVDEEIAAAVLRTLHKAHEALRDNDDL